MGLSRRRVLFAYAVGCIIAASLAVHSPITDEVSAYTVHPAIYIADDSEFTPANGVVSGNGTQEDPFVISGWDITDFGVAIEIIDTDAHFVISDCFVHDSGGYSVLLVRANNGTVTGCDISSNYYGVIVDSCRNVTISENSVRSNSLDGVSLSNSQNVSILNNTIEVNGDDGLFEIGGSGLFEIVGNSITDNLDSGIEIWHAAEIARNTIARNNWYGIGIAGSGSTVHHNNIIGNMIQAFQNDVDTNVWDNGYPDGGNYWSDYAGVDLMNGPDQNLSGGDGIGDTPRTVPVAHEDRYPLMEQFEINRPPVARFEVTPSSGDNSTIFEFNASESWDDETSTYDLIFRWDWESDGTWDTNWTAESNATHQFVVPGNYTVKLEVMDGNNTTGEYSLQIGVAEVIPELLALVVPLMAAALCLIILAFATGTKRRCRKDPA